MFRVGVDLESLSLASHYLRMIPDGVDTPLATGTGFIYEHENSFYLITNAHNVTRVNPETNQRITSSIAFPSKIRTKFRVFLNDVEPIAITTKLYDINLYCDDSFKIPNWYMHPTHGYLVDVVAIPLTPTPTDCKLFPINSYDYFEKGIFADPSDDVFIIGFPLDMTGGKELPIWKKGSIATEPGIDLDNLPKFLIDTATRQGMSGSPVIFQRTGIHGFSKTKPMNPENMQIGMIRSFIGVYSGRIGADDNFKAQLGVVWKKTVIEEIFLAKKRGTIEFQNI